MVWLKSYVGGAEPPLGFAAYSAVHGLRAAQRDPATDRDADSLSDGLEYLTGRDPTKPEAGRPLTWTLGPESLHLSLAVSPLVSEGFLRIESSEELAEWTLEASYDWATATTAGLALDSSAENPLLSFVHPVPAGEARRFFRMGFQLP